MEGTAGSGSTVEVTGSHKIVNIQLGELSHDTTDLSVICKDSSSVDLSRVLKEKDIFLQRLSLDHVNLTPEEKVGIEVKPRQRQKSSTFNHYFQQNEPSEEQRLEKHQQELDLYKNIFSKWNGLSHLEIVDGSGVLTEPIHYIKCLAVTTPQLESLRIEKRMKRRGTDDDLVVLDNSTMSTLAELDNLKVLHLLGFAGRQNRYRRYVLTNLDTAVENLARKGKLEELAFGQSGVTYRGIFALIRHCKDLRTLTVWSRFGEPGLFMLHHNIPFLNLVEHHKDSAVYESDSEDSPRQLTMSLTNVLMDGSRYDPGWVNETHPEEKITEEMLVKSNGVEREESVGDGE